MSELQNPVELARQAALARKSQVESRSILDEDPFQAGTGAPATGPYSPRLYHDLSHANYSLSQIGRNESTQTASRLPLIGKWIDRLKGAMHELTLNYIQRLAERQMVMNVSFVRVLNEMVARSTPDGSAQVATLLSRIDQLEARVAELENAITRRP